VVRIKLLLSYLDNKTINPFIRLLHQKKVVKVISNEDKKYDTIIDHINMNTVIYATNISKLLKYIIIMFISAYYIGIFWFLICMRVEIIFDDDHH